MAEVAGGALDRDDTSDREWEPVAEIEQTTSDNLLLSGVGFANPARGVLCIIKGYCPPASGPLGVANELKY